MDILNIEKMQELQVALWEKNKCIWPPLKPDQARSSLLWMIEEIGETISIIKKRGEKDIISDRCLREAFTEELCDVLMFFTDVLIEFDISPKEFTNIYLKKHYKNMSRDFFNDDLQYLREK